MLKVTSNNSLKSNLFKYRIKRSIDTFLPLIFLAFAFLWLSQSILAITFAVNWNTPVTLWLTPITMHATTSLNLTIIYIINYLLFRTFRFGHERVVRALLFTVFAVVFYDTIWATCNFLVNGSGSFILPLVSTFIIIFYLYITHKKTKILSFNLKFLIPTILIYLFSLYIFLSSGFFQNWGLYEQGLASDPTNWQWLLKKTITLWMWLAIELR
jgi:hypothetical protein